LEWNTVIAMHEIADRDLGNFKPAAESSIDRQNLADWERAYRIVFNDRKHHSMENLTWQPTPR
jgi:hypothetical protein